MAGHRLDCLPSQGHGQARRRERLSTFQLRDAGCVHRNPSTQLSEDDIEWLLGTNANVAYTSFVADTFHGYYFTKAENRWLDRIACNIAALDGGGTTRTRYKKALAEHALVQACLMKRPFNLFHRKNLYLRRANVDRSFGNKTTWDTPFPTLFKRLALEGNEYVFSNGLRNRASNRDATHVAAKDVDFVYLDPPYFRARRDPAQSNINSFTTLLMDSQVLKVGRVD